MTAFGDSPEKWIDLDTIAEDCIMNSKFIDLSKQFYHGGTSMSSGVLPKWDLFGRKYMIKRCTINEFDQQLTDFVNESVVSEFCRLLGIMCAEYYPIKIKYMDMETKRVVSSNATLTKIFGGALEHYRTIRELYNFGSMNDPLLDFTDLFPAIGRDLNTHFLVDFIFNQTDRHSKNFGMMGENLSPIFDSGACMFFDTIDSQLSNELFGMIPRHKTFSKRLDELLEFSLKYVEPEFSVPFDYDMLLIAAKSSLLKYKSFYSQQRFSFIMELIERRLCCAREIYIKTR